MIYPAARDGRPFEEIDIMCEFGWGAPWFVVLPITALLWLVAIVAIAVVVILGRELWRVFWN